MVFESRENTAVGVAVLCLAVCVCSVMNKVGMFDTSVFYLHRKQTCFFLFCFVFLAVFFLPFTDKEQTTIDAPGGGVQIQNKSGFFFVFFFA